LIHHEGCKPVITKLLIYGHTALQTHFFKKLPFDNLLL